jgi:hypothetical protein
MQLISGKIQRAIDRDRTHIIRVLRTPIAPPACLLSSLL